ncbi:MAG: hypothetical protein RMK57_12865 [Bryobacterales bacterium]|nr:hypothetical protein [Bryobacteraceae bacterium]MDW8355408.1 hypothetical protein [Bryobacterales bacterium]
MRPYTLVQMIESHSDQITQTILGRIRQTSSLREIRKLPESELQARAQEVLRRLGHWLALRDESELAAHYEALGRRRFEEGIPLHELVEGFQIVKDCTLDYIRGQGLGQTTVELYAEEELEYRLGRFFDRLIYHVVRGYETALRAAAHRAA